MKRVFVFWIILLFVFTACSAPQEEVVDEVVTPEPQEETPEPEGTQEETETVEEVEEEPEDTGTGGDIVIKGKGVFDPETFRVSKDSVVTFINNGDKLVTLQFWDGKRVFKTDALKPGETFEMTFDKAGTFEVKTLEYLTEATVMVE